ncbi:MAG: 16S rRNA (cytidine(1402)-2'-O)-methyltransferase [Clostridia bacterium]|nr:16S rRNA (cytidine(1402)-2'-O)-methyltransferase [Clostridia bacterium]
MSSEEKNKIVGGTLYLVATPIGNLADMSARAIKVLSKVDFIAAEDTRNTLRMLSALGISASLVSYHDHNRHEAGERICARLSAGESCALVTDAGTPAISDPGEDLVALCAERGIPVTSIPGACAFVTALTLSGLPTRRFCFEGFLPVKGRERRERLEALSRETRTFMLHEAPHKLRTTLDDLAEALGTDRRIALCRELTKLNEEVMRVTLGEAVEYYSAHEPRGEYVLVIDGRGASEDDDELRNMSPEAAVAYYEEQGMPRKEAIKAAARLLGLPKNEVYKYTVNDAKN